MTTAALQAAAPPEPRSLAEVEAVLDKAPAFSDDAAPRPLHVVLLADTKDHGPEEHDYPLWQKHWRVLLGGAGDETTEPQVHLYGSRPPDHPAALRRGAPGLTVSTAWQWPSAEQWASADLVVAFCYLKWSEARYQEVAAFLSRGGGLVLIHSASWTQPAPSAQLASLAGVGGFTRWREGKLQVEVAGKHPICHGLPARIEFEDEAYWPPTPVPAPGAIEILATSGEVVDKASGRTEPQPLFWTHTHGKGRVFGCIPGHYNWTFDDPYFRVLLLRGMAWAAGESPYRFDPLVLRGARVKSGLRTTVGAQPPATEPHGWRLAVAAWSFNRFTFFEAVDRTAALGLRHIEAFVGQRLEPASDTGLDTSLPDAAIAAVRAKLKAANVTLTSIYIHELSAEEPHCRRSFEFARNLGVEMIVSEPKPEALDLIERLCDEYRMRVAIHNHPQGSSLYWHPREVLKVLEGRSPRLGACADIGHWQRSGIKPVEGVRLLGSRLLSLHVKDLNAAGPGGHDVPWGTGQGDLAGVLREVRRLGLKQTLFIIEYEHHWEDNRNEIAACAKFFQQQIQQLSR